MPACRIDHITVTSLTLEAGSDLVFDSLGLRPRQGGQHPRMGTHNLLLRMGDTMFLEVIAVDPRAPPPPRPRWFELDRPAPDSAPRLACWVARTEDIRASLAAAAEPLGEAEPMTRGALEWLISIPPDGSLPMGGVAPALIQWHADTHPAAGMRDEGCRLMALQLLHPDPQRLARTLAALQLHEPDVGLSIHEAASPGMAAQIHTPCGPRWLGSPAC